MRALLTDRFLHLSIMLGCTGLVLAAIFIEPFASMNPCPMCMMQRAVFIAIAVFCLLAVLHNAKGWGKRAYAALILFTSGVGAAIATRQLWLQSLPEDKVPACGPGLDYMLEVFPILEVIEMAIKGTGDCAEVQWTWLGVSIPGWSLIAFIGIAVMAIWMLVRQTPNTIDTAR